MGVTLIKVPPMGVTLIKVPPMKATFIKVPPKEWCLIVIWAVVADMIVQEQTEA